MNRRYYDKDLKLLWGRAAGRCSFPDCRIECSIEAKAQDPAAIIGKVAHIIAHSVIGPRGDPAYPARLTDRYENLILLCPTHHEVVDVQPNTYTASNLRDWMSDHEEWVKRTLAQEVPRVGFAELEIVTKGILVSPAPLDASFVLTPPRAKMARNSLTTETSFLLTMGVAKAREVASFVEQMAVLDPDYPERLKAGFVQKYNEFHENGLTGDALFEALRAFSSGDSSSFAHQAAGLTVLSYLFEKCEVFEP